jgi:hypothetical protein
MFGVLINVLTVIVGSCVGLLFKKGIPEKVSQAAMIGLGACTLYIGITGSLCGENVLILIASVVLGSIFGTLLNIDGVMNKQPRFRLYASKVYMTFTCPLVYEIDKFRTPSNAIQIAPANILGLSDAVKHRYRHIIFVTTTICPNISTRDQYALLKLGQNVTFATTK